MPAEPRARVLLVAAISAGLAFATCCFAPLAAEVAELGLWTIPTLAASAVLCWLVSRAYAELGGMFPSAAGVRTYVGRAFGAPAGRAAALLNLGLVVAIGAAEACVVSQVLARVFPGVAPAAAILALVGVTVTANLLGFEPAGAFQAVLTVAILGAVGALALAVIASGGGGGAPVAFPGAGALTAGVASATFLFIGFEWVVTAVEDVGDRGRALPRGMTWSIALLAATYALLAGAFAYGLAGRAQAGDLAPHVTLGAAWGGRAGLFVAAAISIAATVTTFNSAILGASRLAYALAREGTLPRALALVHPRFFTPWAAIALAGAGTALGALALARTGAVGAAVRAGAAVECLVFAATALALRRLRAREPERPRPYRAPYGRRTAAALAGAFAALAVASVAPVSVTRSQQSQFAEHRKRAADRREASSGNSNPPRSEHGRARPGRLDSPGGSSFFTVGR